METLPGPFVAPARRRVDGISLPRLLLAVLLAGLPATALAKTRYLHGKVGNVEVLSSDTARNTTALLYELLEVREQVRQITGATVAPDPSFLVVVFDSERSFDEFMPENMPLPEPNWRTTSTFLERENGLTVSIIKNTAYEGSRQLVLTFYATYLLRQTLPELPDWIRVGLPEFLSTVSYHGGKIQLGRSARDHDENTHASRLVPLRRLCDDKEMGPYLDSYKHDTVLYHESWSLWHFLLTDPEQSHRDQLHRLFDAVRAGHKADGEGLSQAFGISLDELQAGEKKHVARWTRPVVEVPPATEELMRTLQLVPATELDRLTALATLFGQAGRGLGSHALALLNQASAQPDSPRPYEALAALALGNQDEGDAEQYWGRALEKNSTNPFVYLHAARRQLASQRTYATLHPMISDQVAGRLRGYLDRCLALNPGAMEAYLWESWVEAYAPEPRPAVIQQVEASLAQGLYTDIPFYRAIAYWRLGRKDEAKKLLQEFPHPDERQRRLVESLLQQIKNAEDNDGQAPATQEE